MARKTALILSMRTIEGGVWHSLKLMHVLHSAQQPPHFRPVLHFPLILMILHPSLQGMECSFLSSYFMVPDSWYVASFQALNLTGTRSRGLCRTPCRHTYYDSSEQSQSACGSSTCMCYMCIISEDTCPSTAISRPCSGHQDNPSRDQKMSQIELFQKYNIQIELPFCHMWNDMAIHY